MIYGLRCYHCGKDVVYLKERPAEGKCIMPEDCYYAPGKRQLVYGEAIRCQWCNKRPYWLSVGDIRELGVVEGFPGKPGDRGMERCGLKKYPQEKT